MRSLWIALLTGIAFTVGCSSGGTPPPVVSTVELQEVAGRSAPTGLIEIQGVSAGTFNPMYWQQNTLNWVPDVRAPLLAPQTTGPNQNIYSPWALEQPGGWRLFYGGWDGSETPNDRVYSVSTADFLSFADRQLIIDHGVFEHVNNVNVIQLAGGSFHMVCTVFPDQFNLNKPAYFSSPDGITWNGSPQPYQAQLNDIVSIPDYPSYSSGDFNGANVLFRNQSSWTLYFSNWNDQGPEGTLYRAVANAPPIFSLQGLALATGHMVNDVKRFTVGGQDWYLMGLHTNIGHVWYSLSNDGVRFGGEQTMFGPAYPGDLYLITMCFVTRGNQVLGVLYGGNTGGAFLAQNQIFGRWLQKKVVIRDSAGVQHTAQGGYGPDRQWFQALLPGSLKGTVTVYAEDGVTKLGEGSATLESGKAYALILR